jgi:hypothetical protein
MFKYFFVLTLVGGAIYAVNHPALWSRPIIDVRPDLQSVGQSQAHSTQQRSLRHPYDSVAKNSRSGSRVSC